MMTIQPGVCEQNCPSCDRSFDTHRGLSVHHSQVHGEQLPNRTCDHCGDSFYSDYAKKYCTDDCLQMSNSYSGENHPNYRGAKESTSCDLCGARFDYYPSNKKGLYCSECVTEADWRTLPDITGANNPRWTGGQKTRECYVCGEPVTRHPSNHSGSVTLCGDRCRRRWLSDTFTGEGHPNWKGGGNGPYGKGWASARRQTLQRDGYACVMCGKSKEELGRNPDVHHIVPVRTFVETPGAEKTDAHAPRNLVTLCVACHRRADFGRPTKAELKQVVVGQT